MSTCIIDGCGEEAKDLLCRSHLKRWREYKNKPVPVTANEENLGPFSLNRISASRFVEFYFIECRNMSRK